MTKPPPVPPDNQSHIGPGDTKSGNPDQARNSRARVGNPDEEGQQGNIKHNTRNQGYQQDR
jgi:hypothetical protein